MECDISIPVDRPGAVLSSIDFDRPLLRTFRIAVTIIASSCQSERVEIGQPTTAVLYEPFEVWTTYFLAWRCGLLEDFCLALGDVFDDPVRCQRTVCNTINQNKGGKKIGYLHYACCFSCDDNLN